MKYVAVGEIFDNLLYKTKNYCIQENIQKYT